MKLEELYTKTMSDEALKKAYVDAASEGKLAEFLKANGCETTEEELKAFLDAKQNKTGELEDDELDQVAGGCDDDDNRERCHGYVVIQSTSTETCEYFSERFDYGIVSGPCDDCYYCCKWWEKPVCKCSKRQ